MARRTPAPIWFQTRPSRHLCAYLVAVHVLAWAALWLTPSPAWLRVLTGVVLAIHLAWQIRRHVFRHGAAGIRALHWQADGRWRVLDGTGRLTGYRRVRVDLAAPALILARLTGEQGARWLLLAGDSADPEALRRLRVRLRRAQWQGEADQGPSPAGT